MPEVRRLLLALAEAPAHQHACLTWSRFRRAHQAAAKRGHCARRARRQPETAQPGGDAQAAEVGGMLSAAGTAALTAGAWEQIHPLLPPRRGAPGRPRHEHRRLLEAMRWVMRRGRAWRDLPACYGPWQTAYHRLRQWDREGLWERIRRILHPDAQASPFDP